MPGRHAVWLVPDEAGRIRLASMIDRLARAHATPSFPPHVSLLAGVSLGPDELHVRLGRLALEMRALVVTLGPTRHAAELYRAVTLEVDGPRLAEAHARAAAVFGRPADPAFAAHLSLVYGDLPEAVRESIVGEIARGLDGPCTLDRLDLVRTEGPPPSWRCLHTIPLPPS